MSVADCGCFASATPCPAHIESASICPVVPIIGGAARLAVGDAYLAALTNYSWLAHAVWMTEDAVSHIRKGA
jgi:hypothetical protein